MVSVSDLEDIGYHCEDPHSKIDAFIEASMDTPFSLQITSDIEKGLGFQNPLPIGYEEHIENSPQSTPVSDQHKWAS